MGLLSKVLSTISGNNDLKISEQLLFDKVIGFKSIVPGCGASTILQNVAIALSESTKFNICVLDLFSRISVLDSCLLNSSLSNRYIIS